MPSIRKPPAWIICARNWWACRFPCGPAKRPYVPVAHNYDGAPKQISRRKALEKLRPLLEAEKPLVVGQNLKYDRNVLANYRIGLNGIAHDSMLQSYVLDSVGTRHDMNSLARKYLDKTVTSYEDVAGKGGPNRFPSTRFP